MKDVSKCKSTVEGDPVNTTEVTMGGIVTDVSPSPEGEGQAGLLNAFRLGVSIMIAVDQSPMSISKKCVCVLRRLQIKAITDISFSFYLRNFLYGGGGVHNF